MMMFVVVVIQFQFNLLSTNKTICFSSSSSQTEEDSTVPASYNRSLGELSQQALNTFRPERPQKPLETR